MTTPDTMRTGAGAFRVVRRIPATLTLVAVILAAGIGWRGLWEPFVESSTFDVVASGLPAFREGRWWTPVTGTFFVDHPWVYIFVFAGFVGMAYLEHRRGTRRALAYFVGGQLFAILASALFLAVVSLLPWPWAQSEALALDVGPSGGTMACIAAAVGTLTQPWRVRAWLVLLGFSLSALLFWGSLADLEHAFAVLLVLCVDRSLRLQRTTIREQRLIAFVALLTLAAIEVVTSFTPTDGVFGSTDALDASWIDVGIDLAIIALLANGLRRGRRWA